MRIYYQYIDLYNDKCGRAGKMMTNSPVNTRETTSSIKLSFNSYIEFDRNRTILSLRYVFPVHMALTRRMQSTFLGSLSTKTPRTIQLYSNNFAVLVNVFILFGKIPFFPINKNIV